MESNVINFQIWIPTRKEIIDSKTKNTHLLFESTRYKILKWWEEIIAVFNTLRLGGVIHRTLKF